MSHIDHVRHTHGWCRGQGVSQVCMRHATHSQELCHTHLGFHFASLVMSHMWIMYVTHMNHVCHPYARGVMKTICYTYESCMTTMEWCPTCTWDMSHVHARHIVRIQMSHVSHAHLCSELLKCASGHDMNESHHAYEWVMSNAPFSKALQICI